MFWLVASDVIVNLGHARIPHCRREPARLLLCHNVRFASVQYWNGDFFPVLIVHVRPFHVADEIEQGGDIEVHRDVRLAAIAAIQEGEKFEFNPGRHARGQ